MNYMAFAVSNGSVSECWLLRGIYLFLACINYFLNQMYVVSVMYTLVPKSPCDTSVPGPDITLKEVGPPIQSSKEIAKVQSATTPERNQKPPTYLNDYVV